MARCRQHVRQRISRCSGKHRVRSRQRLASAREGGSVDVGCGRPLRERSAMTGEVAVIFELREGRGTDGHLDVRSQVHHHAGAMRVLSQLSCLLLLVSSALASERPWQQLSDPSLAEVASHFGSPPPEYGVTLWWGWDGPVDEAVITRDLDAIKAKGIRSVLIEAGYGMKAPYLSPGWFALVRFAVEQARDRGMRVWVEDEGKYPSGFAGGKVQRPSARPADAGSGCSREGRDGCGRDADTQAFAGRGGRGGGQPGRQQQPGRGAGRRRAALVGARGSVAGADRRTPVPYFSDARCEQPHPWQGRHELPLRLPESCGDAAVHRLDARTVQAGHRARSSGAPSWASWATSPTMASRPGHRRS